MKIKRLLAWLLVLAMCFMLAACVKDAGEEDFSASKNKKPTTQTADPAQTGTATPLLYRVTDQKGDVIWLFGSIHVGRENYYPLPDYVLDAFAGADSLAVEVDIVALEEDMGLQMQALSPLVYADGSTIKDHISQDLYDKAVEILKEYKSYSSMMDVYCPALWSSMIESLMAQELGADGNLGIDRHLINKAYEDEKEILAIESAVFQYQMLADFDDDVQLMMLESAVEMYEDTDVAADELEMMMDLWASGDESAFAAYLSETDETMTDAEKKTYAKYNQAMIVDRNLTMTEYAENALASGKEVFICVGAAHVVGDGAMADLLSQRGYTVECITKNTSPKPDPTNPTVPSNPTTPSENDPTEPTGQFFKTEDITSITFYAYYGSGKGSKVSKKDMTEIINWLNSFAIDREATDEDVLPGTNTYYVEITYSDGTLIKKGLDVVVVDGVRYLLKKDKYPDCFREIISKTDFR